MALFGFSLLPDLPPGNLTTNLFAIVLLTIGMFSILYGIFAFCKLFQSQKTISGYENGVQIDNVYIPWSGIVGVNYILTETEVSGIKTHKYDWEFILIGGHKEKISVSNLFNTGGYIDVDEFNNLISEYVRRGPR